MKNAVSLDSRMPPELLGRLAAEENSYVRPSLSTRCCTGVPLKADVQRRKSVSEVARTFSVHPATLYRILAPTS
jgi:hypothetical protein